MNRGTLSEKRDRLTALYYSGKPFRLIAEEYGGTAQGVRSTVRKMIERGELEQRGPPCPRNDWWMRQPRDEFGRRWA